MAKSCLLVRSPLNSLCLAVLPMCMKKMKQYWDKPFRHIANSEDLGFADPPSSGTVGGVHLHLNHRSTLALAGPARPGKMEHFTASMYQNVVTLLTAYQAVFDLCLPRKATPHPRPPTCPGFAAVAVRGHSRSVKGPKFQSPEQSVTHQHGSQGLKQWGKKSFANATSTSASVSSRSFHQPNGKKRQAT